MPPYDSRLLSHLQSSQEYWSDTLCRVTWRHTVLTTGGRRDYRLLFTEKLTWKRNQSYVKTVIYWSCLKFFFCDVYWSFCPLDSAIDYLFSVFLYQRWLNGGYSRYSGVICRAAPCGVHVLINGTCYAVTKGLKQSDILWNIDAFMPLFMFGITKKNILNYLSCVYCTEIRCSARNLQLNAF